MNDGLVLREGTQLDRRPGGSEGRDLVLLSQRGIPEYRVERIQLLR